MMGIWIITSDLGVRRWNAEDKDHAAEQHRDAHPDEDIHSIIEDRILTIEQARLLSQMVRGVERNAKLRYYPYGAETAVDEPRVGSYTMRAFTREDGTLYPHEADIRDAFVWCSGTFERWFKVSDLLIAMDNITSGRHGITNPMAVIDFTKE
jgi:hypothetical protein